MDNKRKNRIYGVEDENFPGESKHGAEAMNIPPLRSDKPSDQATSQDDE